MSDLQVVERPVSAWQWRQAVIRRDKKCVRCESADNLHAHHVERRAARPDLALDIENGMTLCAECHADEHTGEISAPLEGALRASKPRTPKQRTQADPDWLQSLGVTRAALASQLGISVGQLDQWIDSPPQYAVNVAETLRHV